MGRLVSIIMPAYNAEPYIEEAIGSVLAQTHAEWELLLVNDGSTDRTASIIDTFSDPRIRVFHKTNGGIGSARNMALEHATGDYICGLDADDVFPPDSLAARLAIFTAYPDTDIVDGCVIFKNGTLQTVQRTFVPTFIGEPFHELIALNASCFMGFSWLIRWSRDLPYRFDERITHGEDLLFYLAYAPHRSYRFTTSTVLVYRRTGSSAMSNLKGLERSYRHIAEQLSIQGVATASELKRFKRRTLRIMVASYLRDRDPWNAIRCLFTRPRPS